MSVWRAAALAGAVAWAGSAGAVEISAPDGAEPLAHRVEPAAPHGIAVGPAAPFMPPAEQIADGPLHRLSWRGPEGDAALDLLQAVQSQLEEAGFEVLFTCAARACGGFDFRSALPVLPSPEMFVSLGSFTYVALHRQKDGSEDELAALLASSGGQAAYLQLTLVGALTEAAPVAEAPRPQPNPGLAQTASAKNNANLHVPGDLEARLIRNGHAALEGMGFDAGQDDMAATIPPILQDLAAFLKADPARRVALVGHSDWTGSGEMNRQLSRQRAEAVAGILTGELGVDPDQVDSFGAGFLSPRQPNDSEAGRAANRRVEVVLLPPAE